MDEDLRSLSREELVAEVERLRKGIRAHRDASGHELCWHHPELWNLLPEKVRPKYPGAIRNGRLAGVFRPLLRCAPSTITP